MSEETEYIEGEPVDVLITERGGNTWWYSGKWFYLRKVVEGGKVKHVIIDDTGNYTSDTCYIRRPLTHEQRMKDLEQWRSKKLEAIELQYQKRLAKINRGESDEYGE